MLYSTRNVSSWEEAESLVKKMDKERESFVKRFTLKYISDLYNFELVINVGKNTIEEVTDIIINALKNKKTDINFKTVIFIFLRIQ